MDDEARAQRWRDEQRQKARGLQAIDDRLSRGNPTAYAVFRAGWEPLRLWLAERHASEPLPDEPEIRGN